MTTATPPAHPEKPPASFDDALDAVAAALDAMGHGDPGPFAALWTRTDDATLMGGFGTHATTAAEVASTLEAVARRFRGGALVPEYDRVLVGDDWAMTAGRERGILSVDGAAPAPFVVRVTHVWRREGDGWRIVHRHGDHTTTAT
ncbi:MULTISPECIES: nuclear transport factor 2 family protein [Microbacterium]|uniref:YybH family protein n=1 Tax=Microbacterium TaxID=33882 RepID=UPI0027890AA4|nr:MULTISPECIES: nuclear transport factor 2 family protein [Microbacterium]MDQ1084510.1 ketosteroid isomerase-like protein [Microbacterium sp. SORGH_AS_0344]MDQ1170213.1 ketosteroid isomerase-like protein [Microbacterium proteolyticum]